MPIAVATMLCCTTAAGVAGDGDESKRAAWEPNDALSISPEALHGLPKGSAGCVVVGHYIYADGTVAKPRVMQAAFTQDVSAEAQRRFGEAASTAVAATAFRHVRSGSKPQSTFGLTALGFASAAGEAPRFVDAPESQDKRVDNACELRELAAWGTRHAVSAEQAAASDTGRILAPYREPVEAFWADAAEKVAPRYPVVAYRSGVVGCVVVGMLVRHDGTPEGFRIMETAIRPGPHPVAEKALQDAALQAASRWRFAPGPDNLQRMRAFIQIPVSYALDGFPRSDCGPLDLAKSDATGR